MSIQFLSIIFMYFLLDYFVLFLMYKIFTKYRYKEMLKINLDDINSIDKSDFNCCGSPIDMFNALILLGVIMLLTIIIDNYVIFGSKFGYIYFDYIGIGCLPCVFPFFILCYIVRSYKEYKNDYQNYLFYECFRYNGKKIKLLSDNKKYRRNSNLVIKRSDLIEQAEKERKGIKQFIVVCVAIAQIA